MTTEKAQVRPNVPTGRILLDNNHITMRPGEIRELKATVFPMLTYDKTNLTPNEIQNAVLLSMLITDKTEYTSSDAEIASVDENGIVTAIQEGTCKITVKSGEHEFTCDVLVDFQKKADEEFLEYVERIGAYTELPLGTDGSAGPTAQYVTFGFERSVDELLVGVDECTKTTYKGYDYAKGDDDEWYWFWSYGWGRYKITPRKWRILDKEKGLMVMENYSSNKTDLLTCSKEFSMFYYRPDDTSNYYAYYNKNIMDEDSTICNYESSYLRAYLDGGKFYQWFDFFEMEDGNFKRDKNNKMIYNGYTERHEFRMNENRTWTDFAGRHYDYPACTNTDNPFQNFFAPGQLAQIQNVDLDCGEGGSVKGRLFILSADEIKKYYSDGSKLCLNAPYDGKTFWTRTRVKGSDGKPKLLAVKTNSDGTVKEVVELEGYDTGDRHYFIPAICVKPAP